MSAHFYESDIKFAEFINTHCVGKTIAKAYPLDTFMVHTVCVEFTDGTKIEISGESDEGFEVEFGDLD